MSRTDIQTNPGNINADKKQSERQLETKAQEWLEQLTLDEKLEIMDGDVSFWPGMAEVLEGKYNERPWIAGVIGKIGNPGVRFSDGPRGIVLKGATTFPAAMARGASWDTDLEERIGEAVGRELRASGGNLFGGVCINLLRHPAWGRAQETFGEDPHHLGEMGAALIRGVQKHAMACVKHFALNSIENARFKVDVRINQRALHEIYLAHFKRAVDEGVACVMSAYNSVNGEWCGQNRTLLTDILKKKWGFRGFVVTDWFFGLRDAKKAALAGQDLEMPFKNHYHRHLRELIENGEIAPELIDESVFRLLSRQSRFVRPGSYDKTLIGCKNHRALALESAEKSIVLLQNKENLLPLRKVKRIAVMGRLAGIPNTGDGGSSNTRPDYVITPLAGIKDAFEYSAEVLYDDGADIKQAQAAARDSDAVIIVAGYTHNDEGEFLDPEAMKELASLFPPPAPGEEHIARLFAEGDTGDSDIGLMPGGDRDLLTLSPEDEALILAISNVNKRTAVAVMGGSAIIMEAWRDKVQAILMLWYPGMEGGKALANILTGKVSPGGRLPFVIPEKEDHLPFFDKNAVQIEYDLWHGYRKLEREGHTPAFPFGYGLTYTDFKYKNLNLHQINIKTSDALQMNMEVSNTGKHFAEEVVQVYVSAIDSAVDRAPKELKAFTRVAVRPGESAGVEFKIPASRFAYYDEDTEEFVVEQIEYEVFVGANSLDPHALKARFRIIDKE